MSILSKIRYKNRTRKWKMGILYRAYSRQIIFSKTYFFRNFLRCSMRDGGLHIQRLIGRGLTSSLVKGFKGTKGRMDWFRDKSWQLRCCFRLKNVVDYRLRNELFTSCSLYDLIIRLPFRYLNKTKNYNKWRIILRIWSLFSTLKQLKE